MNPYRGDCPKVTFLREFGGLHVCRADGDESSVSKSGKVAWVAPMVMRYPYHCVPSRMGVLSVTSLRVPDVNLAYPKVRNLGCVL